MHEGPIERLNTALGGRYRIERELGEGGMATVYLAEDPKHGRRVAIKVLHPGLGEAMGPERFLREIEIAARMSHPNILALHDSGEADGSLYFVMPYVEGESLRDRLDRERALSLEDASRIIREVGGALGYAHERGLVHRDVKPENVLFQAGHAVVCDFGIAKIATEAKDRMTRAGTSIGTLAYMSPEQLGEDGEVDARSDVYALGCMLYEMLDGEAPFASSSRQATVAKKLLGERPAGLDRLDVPDTVRDVIVRCLHADPEGRFESAPALVEALGHATTALAIERDTRRRRRATLLRGTATLVAVGLLGVGGWWARSLLRAPAFERIAVLPLVNASNDTTTNYFVSGFHEDLVVELQRAGVRVTNPRSVRRYAESDFTLRQIAEDLGVDAVVEGAAELRDGTVEIELQLTDPETLDLVWTADFSSPERGVLALVRDVTRSIADEAGIELSEETLARLAEAPQVNPLVYEALLKGRYERLRTTAASLDQAERFYELALSLDSTEVLAWVGLAGVWNTRAQQGLITAEEATERAAPFLETARRLDPDLGEDHAFRATRLTWPAWREGRWLEAEEAFQQALEQDPSDATTRAYFAQLLLMLGKREEAIEQTYWAADQAPDDARVLYLHAQLLRDLREPDRWEEAVTKLRRAEELDPEMTNVPSTQRAIYHLLGRQDDAIVAWRRWMRLRGDDEAKLAALDEGWDAGGYSEAIRRVGQYLEARIAAGDPPSIWQIGTTYARSGDYDKAIEYLERAVAEGDPNVPYLSTDAIFDPLRSDPRFQALIDQLNLPGRS